MSEGILSSLAYSVNNTFIYVFICEPYLVTYVGYIYNCCMCVFQRADLPTDQTQGVKGTVWCDHFVCLMGE